MIWRLQASWEWSSKEEKVVLSSHIGESSLVISEINKNSINLLLDFLRNGLSIEQYLNKCDKLKISQVQAKLIFDKLKSVGAIIKSDISPSSYINAEDRPYDRQIRFFNTYEGESNSGELIHKQLQQSTVLIVGLGGYGSWLSVLMAKTGVKSIIGIDFDVIEVSNLDRQITYSPSDVGKIKSEIAENFCNQYSQSGTTFEGVNLKVTSPEELYPYIEKCDLVFNPFGYRPVEEAHEYIGGIVAKACMVKRVPMLTLGGNAVGPLHIPNESPCYFCTCKQLNSLLGVDINKRNPMIQKRVFAPTISSLCSLASWEAISFLSDFSEPRTKDKLLRIDWSQSYSQNRITKINKDVECNYCGASNE